MTALTRAGHNVTPAPTTGPRTAGAIARKHIERGADLILVAGGDGTINEVAEGMVGSSVPMGILPAGTANVLCMETRMGSDLIRAAARLDRLTPRRVSLGRVTFGDGAPARHFLLMAGIGLDAQIVYRVNAALKARVGKLAYWLAGWTMLGRLPQFEVETDGGTGCASFALFSKVRNYGGDFEIARSVTLLDGDFEAVLFSGGTSFHYVKHFFGMALNRLAGMKGVDVRRVRCARLSCAAAERVFVQIDGELAGCLPAQIDIVPDAVTLLVPAEYGRS